MFTRRGHSRAQLRLPPSTPPPQRLSVYSSPLVPDAGYCSQNFMLGAGMVIIQPSTHKFVLVYETERKYWFFPKGRKDRGESLETTALREAYEESGYQPEFLPIYTPSHAPPPPDDPDSLYRPNTEPIYLSLTSWSHRYQSRGVGESSGGEYLTSWYVGQIPENAVRQTGTGMTNEQHYTSHLFTFEEALERLEGVEKDILSYAWIVYCHTLEVEEQNEQDHRDSVEPRSSNDKPRPGSGAYSS